MIFINFFIFIKDKPVLSARIRKICKDRKMSEIHGKDTVLYHKNNSYPADCVSLYFDDISFQYFSENVEGMEEKSRNVYYNNAEGLEQKSYFIYFDEGMDEEELLDLIRKNIKKAKK